MSRGGDMDGAIGVQLDATGGRGGRSRELSLPLQGVYFALDISGVGLDEGIWKGEFDPESGLTTLPDDQYRTLLKAKVAANAWDGTTPGAYDVWETAFSDSGSYIVIQDNQDMSMAIGIAGLQLDRVTEQLLLQGYLPLKPEGVRVSYYAVSSNEGPLFALDAESEALAGLDHGSWATIIQA